MVNKQFYTFKKQDLAGIKYLYACQSRSSTIEVAFIGSKYEFCHFQFKFKPSSSDISRMLKLSHMFRMFTFDHSTSIALDSSISSSSFMFTFFKLIQQYLQFSMKSVSIDRAVQRIYYFHSTYSKKQLKMMTAKDIPSLWDKLIKLERCPWITSEDDKKLLNMSGWNCKLGKKLRIGLYYLAIKQYLMNNHMKSILKKSNKSNQLLC